MLRTKLFQGFAILVIVVGLLSAFVGIRMIRGRVGDEAQTRGNLAEALDALSTKRDWRPQKKHGLIPL